MPKVESVENKIFRTEKFHVALVQNGKNVRGDKEGLPQYSYGSAASGTWTVSEWKEKRFKQSYPGYDVRVLKKDGSEAKGQMTLATVRG